MQVDRQKDSFIAAFRLKDGKPAWRTAREEIPSWGTPTVYQGPPRDEVVTHGDEVHPRPTTRATGKELWRLGPNSEITTPTPIVAHGLIFVTNGYSRHPAHLRDQAGRHRRPHAGRARRPRARSSPGARSAAGVYTPTPVVYEDLLYLLSNQGVLSAYDARTGERVYQERVAGKGGAFSASPVAADGKLYLAGEDGDVFVVQAPGASPSGSPPTRWARS